MKRWKRVICAGLVLGSCMFLASCGAPAREGLANEFFAMDTGTIDADHKTAKAQAEMVKELGYAGIAYWEGNPKRGDYDLREMLRELDRNGLKIWPLYVGVWLDKGKARYEESLPEAIEQLRGRDAMVWLHIMSKEYEKSSPEGDERAVEIIREVADMGEEAGVRVALYPHVNEWLERHDDALRVVEKVGKGNVGLSFNLVHRLLIEGEEGIDEQLGRLRPYLFTVTINGSSKTGSIETLDSGEFDVYKLLSTLKGLGYDGPVGLQGWGIKGDVRENLARSMAAWRKFSGRMAAEEKLGQSLRDRTRRRRPGRTYRY